MSSNTGWLQHIPNRQVSFTSLRTGQWPKHPRPVHEEKPGKPPAMLDQGTPPQSRDTLFGILKDPTEPDTRPDWMKSGAPPSAWWMQSPTAGVDPQIASDGWQSQSGERGEWDNTVPSDVGQVDSRPDWMKSPDTLKRNPDAPTPPGDEAADLHGVPNPPPGIPGAAERMADYRDQIRLYPEKTDPKWWQRLAGAAAGAGAGWSNAASRTRHPIDIGSLQENILHPGYAEKVQKWNSQFAPMQAAVNIDASQRAAQLAQAKEQSAAGLQSAQAELAQARAKAASLPSKSMVDVTPEMATASKGLLRPGMKITGQDLKELIHDTLTTPTPDKIQTVKILTEEFSKATGQPIGAEVPTAVYETAIRNMKAANPTKWAAYVQAAGGDPAKALELARQDAISTHAAERDPGVAEARAQRTEDQRINANQVTDTHKLQAEQAARSHFDAAVRGGANPVEAKAALANTLQGIQDSYARTVRARGGAAQDFDINPKTLAAVPRGGAPSPPPTAGPANPYIAGRVYGGLKYLGGDPKSQSSWAKR